MVFCVGVCRGVAVCVRRYVSDRFNLMRIMSLLRHTNPAIQIEAFHIFKVRCVCGVCVWDNARPRIVSKACLW